MIEFVSETSDGYTVLGSKMCTGDVCVCPDRDIELVKQGDGSMKIKGLKKGLKFKASSL